MYMESMVTSNNTDWQQQGSRLSGELLGVRKGVEAGQWSGAEAHKKGG